MPIEPLKKSELVKYFQVYREAFPDWNVEHKVMLTRSLGPIAQHIDFQALRSGDYRPSCSIRVVGPPGYPSVLNKHLDIKHREISRREHDMMWPLVIKAMEEQFLPSVRKPLDIAEVLRLAEEEAERDGIENINYSNGLAALNVYVGHMDRAIYWCNRVEAQFDALDYEPADWQQNHVQFARQLCDAIQSGRGPEFLAEAADPSSA